jgi:hypothetical protein
VTFNKTAPYPRDVFECAGDKEMKDSIFVNEGLPDNDSDKDKPLLSSTSSSEHVPTSTLEAKALQTTTSSIVALEASWVEGEIVFELEATSHIQKSHPP